VEGNAHGIGRGISIELSHHVSAMNLDSPGANAQDLRDFDIRLSHNQVHQHVALARR
jgi:hypothetical protein